MIIMTKEGNSANVPVRQYVADTEDDLSLIPSNAPFGSSVLILETEKGGSSVKIKNSHGEWIEV